jgi:hypothetical protein
MGDTEDRVQLAAVILALQSPFFETEAITIEPING